MLRLSRSGNSGNRALPDLKVKSKIKGDWGLAFFKVWRQELLYLSYFVTTTSASIKPSALDHFRCKLTPKDGEMVTSLSDGLSVQVKARKIKESPTGSPEMTKRPSLRDQMKVPTFFISG